MSAHTPGPWFYDDGEGGRLFPHVVLGDGNSRARWYLVLPFLYQLDLVNNCSGKNGGLMGECQANARLIAAAPDLLEALCSISLAGNDNTAPAHVVLADAVAKARAAIKKARGES